MNKGAGKPLEGVRTKVFWLAIVLLLVLALSSCVVSSPAIDGRVVDAQTHEPIEGANILAHWVLGYWHFEYQSAGELQVIEAVTDRDGRFHIPKWRRVRSPFSRGSVQAGEDPEVLIFKDGYSLKKGRNFPPKLERLMGSQAAGEGQLADSIRPNEWAGWEFKLRRSEGNAKQEEKELNDFFSSLQDIVQPSSQYPYQCFWANARQILQAVDAAHDRVAPIEVRNLLKSLRSEITACGQAKEFGWDVK